tara:strand:- start:881 stop:3364 length:2484 start_codon:yes stop_codon:yes gene_type:complete
MATTVDTLLVRVEADLKDVNQKLARFDKQVDNTAKKAGRNFQKISNIAKVALGAVIVHQFAQAGMAAVRFASSVEEMQAKSSVVFGAFTGEVRQALDAFGNEVGRSTFELEGMAASIQDTFVPMGFARGEAAKLSVELTKLAVDVASFNNASDTETMAAFQSALVGNHETVRRFGIVITEATLQQELYRMGITKNAQDVDNATKVQARMNLILAGTTDAQGDAARTSDSFANTSKALKAALDELLVNVVTPLLPALTSLARGLVNVTNNLNAFLQSIGLIEAVGLETANALGQIAEKQGEINEQTRLMAETQALLDMTPMERGLKGKGTHFLKKDIEEAREAIAKLKSEQADLATFVVADSFAAADVSTGGDDSKTKGQIKAEEKVTEAINDQRFAVRLLRDEIDGRTSAELRALKVMRDLTAATDAQLNEILNLFREEEKLQAQLDATAAKEKAREQLSKAVKEAQKQRTDVIRELVFANQELEMQVDGVSQEEQLFAELTRDLIGLTALETERIKELIATKFDLEKQIKETTAANDNYNESVEAGIAFVAQNKTDMEILGEKIENVTNAYRAGKISIEEFDAAMAKLAETNEKSNAAVDRGRSFVEGLSDKQRELELVLEDVAAAYGVNSEEFAKAQAQIKHEIDMLDPMFKQQMEAVQSMSRGMSDAFADMLMSGKFNMDSLRDVFSSFVKTMLSKALELMVFNQIMNRVFNLSGPAALPTASFPSLGASAGGGRVQGPTLVGERGPELFVPSSAGVIRNNHDTKNMLGQSGAVVNQSITIDAGVSQTVRAEIMTMMPVFKQQALEAVVESRRRGGQVASAFGR